MIERRGKSGAACGIAVTACRNAERNNACFDGIECNVGAHVEVTGGRIATQTYGKNITYTVAVKGGHRSRAIVVAFDAVMVSYCAGIVAVFIQSFGQQLLGKEIRKTHPLLAPERIPDDEFEVS